VERRELYGLPRESEPDRTRPNGLDRRHHRADQHERLLSLSHFPATGNSRKATIRSNYSGVSFNSSYNISMIGSGGKTLTIRKKGKSNPRYVMSFSDILNERAQVGGQLYTFWRIGGSLSKR
jgi:hypothetical protein